MPTSRRRRWRRTTRRGLPRPSATTVAGRSRRWPWPSPGSSLTRPDIGGMIGLGGSGGTALITPAMRALPVGMPKVMVSTVASGNVAPYVGPRRHLHDVLGHRRRRDQPDLAPGAGQRRPRARRHAGAPGAGGGGRQAGARAHHVRRDHALRRAGRERARGRLRLPRVPRHRHRRPVDGEAGRFRADRGRDRRHHDRGLRPADGRRVQRRRGPARRDRAHGRPLRRLLRRARHGQLRRARHRAGALPGAQSLRPQPAGHADAHHARGEPPDRRLDRREAQRLRGRGPLPAAGGRRLADRRAGPAVPRPRGRRRAVRGARGDRAADRAPPPDPPAAQPQRSRRSPRRWSPASARSRGSSVMPRFERAALLEQVPGHGGAARADRRRRRRHRPVGQMRGGGRHRPDRDLQLRALPDGRARLARGPARLRQRQRDRARDGQGGAAGGRAHAGAGRRQRHRPVPDPRRLPRAG